MKEIQNYENMNANLASSNVSFNFLKDSSTFLNLIINNISSCVLLLDRDMRLRAFNDSLKSIFSNKKDEDLLYKKCGDAIGCAYLIEEKEECGNTKHCCNCELREAAIKSYLNNEVIYKENIEKPFFDYNYYKINKILQFSTRLFKHDDEKYIILMIDDVSKYRHT